VDLRVPAAEAAPKSEGLKNPSASSATVPDASGHRRVLEDVIQAIETGSEPL
jgi:hypothetical protein